MKFKVMESIHKNQKKKIYLFLVGMLLFSIQMIAYFYSYHFLYRDKPIFSIFFPVFFVYLLSKLLFSIFYKVYPKNSLNKSVAVLIPFYNENFEIMEEQYKSLLNQTYKNFTIYYVDDGSTNTEVYEKVKNMVRGNPKVKLYRKENGGKRAAQMFLLKFTSEELIYTTDSDTVMDPNCIQELVYPFIDEKIMAVTGQVQTYNSGENLLTRLLQIRYYAAFESERAAQSWSENVIVCSGPNSLYRRVVLVENEEEYLNQKFLGQIQTFGDDRCLTNMAMRYGMAKYQGTSITYTEIPSSIQSLTKQQIRWGKSFFRESYFAIKNTIKVGRWITLIWVLLEVFMVGFFLTSLYLFFYNLLIGNLNMIDILFFFSFTIVNAYIRNIYYINYDYKTFMLAPLYGFLHLIWVTPLKIYSFLSLKNTGWGTR